MTPLRITAHLAEPVATYDRGLYLDGLLAYAQLRRRQRAGETFPDPNHTDWPVDFVLPLAKWHAPIAGRCHARLLDGDGKVWGWRSSDVCWPEQSARGSVAVRKMTDQDQMVRHTDAPRLKTSTGRMKPQDKTYPTRQARQVWWWAVGDAEAVRELLREVTHLGKLHNSGQGRVMAWGVEAVDEDRSLVHDGRLARRLPDTVYESDTTPRRGTIRPPYWHTSRECECLPAGAEVTDG